MNKSAAIAILITMSVLLVVVFAFSRSSSGFSVTSSSPSEDQRDVAIDSAIEINFSENIQVDLPSINDPSVDYSEYETRIETRPTIVADIITEGNTFRMIPRHSLLENQEYSIFLSNVVSDEDAVIDQYQLLFTTGQDDSARAQFIRSLPVYRDNYNVTYSSTRDAFVVQVTSGDAEQVTAEAYDFLEDRGLDIDSENIITDVLRTNQGGGSPAG